MAREHRPATFLGTDSILQGLARSQILMMSTHGVSMTDENPTFSGIPAIGQHGARSLVQLLVPELHTDPALTSSQLLGQNSDQQNDGPLPKSMGRWAYVGSGAERDVCALLVLGKLGHEP